MKLASEIRTRQAGERLEISVDTICPWTSKAHRRKGAVQAVVEEKGPKVPQCDEQVAIANTLSDMDREIESLEKRRDKTQRIEQGVVQQLLTGRVRPV